MDEAILTLENQQVGLRENEDGTFSPKNSRIFDSLIKEVELDKFQVCLIVKDCSETIGQELQRIEEKMQGRRWVFLVGDYSKNEKTYDVITKHESSACEFFPIRLKYSKSGESARKAINKIADIYTKNFPLRLEFEKGPSSTLRHEIQSFCFVATKEVKEEAAVLIKSLREFHSQPVYIYCDKETKYFLSCLDLDLKGAFFKVETKEEALEKIERCSAVERKNNYHKPECILRKMDCMDIALRNHDNTLFLDSDIIVVSSLEEGFDKNVFLSPHYHKLGTPSSNKAIEYGFFNAGYVFCADANFPDFWRETYLGDSDFFEQECMNRICEKFDVGFFSELHNVGFWRDYYSMKSDTKSFHVHITQNENLENSITLKAANESLKARVIKFLKESSDEKHKKIFKFIEKMDSGWGGTQESFALKVSNPNGRINLSSQITFNSHRSGWKYAIDALTPLHNKEGVLFDGFLENNFAWHLEEYRREGKRVPYREPWVGFFHNPQNMPPWFFNQFSLQNIIAGKEFQESLNECLGLFSLSEYQAEYLRQATGKKVISLIHPTEIPDRVFDYEKFLNNKNKKIVNIGYWLRKLNSIFALPIPCGNEYNKIRLIPYSASRPMETIDELVNKEKKLYDIEIEGMYIENTTTKSSLSNEDYDQLLSENVIFLDLYDSSANNAIIECIARATPLLVNPLPAVVEYLGKDYPLYYDSLEEAAEKVENFDLVKAAHEYLRDCETRQKLSQEYFKNSFEQSEVYDLLK